MIGIAVLYWYLINFFLRYKLQPHSDFEKIFMPTPIIVCILAALYLCSEALRENPLIVYENGISLPQRTFTQLIKSVPENFIDFSIIQKIIFVSHVFDGKYILITIKGKYQKEKVITIFGNRIYNFESLRKTLKKRVVILDRTGKIDKNFLGASIKYYQRRKKRLT